MPIKACVRVIYVYQRTCLYEHVKNICISVIENIISCLKCGDDRISYTQTKNKQYVQYFDFSNSHVVNSDTNI
jgi:hypothetical protein